MPCNEQVQKLARGNEMMMNGDRLEEILEKQRVLGLAISGLFDAALLPAEYMGLVKLANEVADSLQQVIEVNDQPAVELALAV
ncbi:hypothetical protein [Geobacter pickeringii]|uniref:Uncharacterized protein n=1 Tax=Geobacter pickeringii TaxID=345632 RepID=A0A0B5BE63_9BACT|nr:hypothetical protein [Geobacter pickeringii]AJE03434.1 hypothetical protein GPICK_08770 [Geobacter pickeringii]